MNYHSKWKKYLLEAERDAKVLRNINIDFIKKEMPIKPDEEVRDYFARIQQLERDPFYMNPIFPQVLVDWMESLPDEYFPTQGRKRFAKWLGNSVYYHQAETLNNAAAFTNIEDLQVYNNDVRYIADYLNGSDDFPTDLWEKSLNGMYDLAVEWHETLKFKEDPTGTYKTKDIVHQFENGFSIVKVPPQDLETEGEHMGHCVGGYCDAVNSGALEIYSLRDKKNRPHATIELAKARYEEQPTIRQIKGKGNDTPVDKYRPMIKQWLATTEFSYLDNTDYIALLSEEEITQLIHSGKASYRMINDLAARTRSSDIINYFINAIADPSGDKLRAMANVNRSALLVAVASNPTINEEQLLKIVEIDLDLGILGRAVERLFHDPFPDLGETRPHASITGPKIWKNFKDKITQNLGENSFYYLDSIVKYSDSEALGREILEFLLDKSVFSSFIEASDSISRNPIARLPGSYGNMIQSYLLYHHPTISRGTLEQIHQFAASYSGKILIGSYPIEPYLANCAAITSSMVEDLIDSAKIEANEGPTGFSVQTMRNLVMNSSVKESYKYQIIKLTLHYKPRMVRMLGDHIYKHTQEAPSGKSPFSRKFLIWCLDSGVFDNRAKAKASAFVSKYGTQPEPGQSSEYDKMLSQSREEIKKELLEMTPTQKVRDTVQENIEKYFKTKAPSTAFYREVESGLLNEEKGRSRQRGIYKFYCMLGYTLTITEDRSRGLDDILADLRALPHVTIVTVVIRNQKIAEGRYVAGLSLKFIPSVPGQFNSPEQTKAKILQNVKRLSNVEKVFKVSSGLERLE